MRPAILISLIILFSCNSFALAEASLWQQYETKAVQAKQAHDLPTAEKYFGKALDAAEKSHSDLKLLEVLVNLVQVRMLQGNSLDAQPIFDRTIEIAQRAKKQPYNKKSVSLLMNNLADFYYRLGESIDSDKVKIYCVEHYADSKLAATDSFDPILRPRINMLSAWYTMHGQYPEAEQVAFKSRITIDRDPKKGELDYWCGVMGNIVLLQNKFDEAEKYYKNALAVKDNFYPEQKTLHQACLEQQLGTIEYEKGNLSPAISHLNNAIKLYKTGFDDRGVAFSYYILGVIENKLNNDKEAARYFSASLDKSKKLDFPALQVMSAAHLSNELKKLGDANGRKAVGAYVDKVSAAHPEWGQISCSDPDTFFIVCGLLPHPTDIIRSHTHLDLY